MPNKKPTDDDPSANAVLTQVSETKFLKAHLSSAVPKSKSQTSASGSDPYYPPSRYSSKRESNNLNPTKSNSSMISHHSINDDIISTDMSVDPDGKYYFDISSYDKSVDSLIIHLNIQEHHYYITRDQLLSLPESLLLCLFPNGVFMNRQGEVIQTLTEEDEVYVFNFSFESFEYIMDVYSQATFDLSNFPLSKLMELYGDPVAVQAANNSSHGSGGFFSSLAHHASVSTSSNTSFGSHGKSGHTETSLLENNPSIIVLREDLDYYCIPLNVKIEPATHELLDIFMRSIKLAAGSYLTNQKSIFEGLYCSNKVEVNKETGEKKLGVAEQHLMDMLCSSGLPKDSVWGNRTQEIDKTVISSLSLIRLYNETTKHYRDILEQGYEKGLEEDSAKINQLKLKQKQQQQFPGSSQLNPQSGISNDSRESSVDLTSSSTAHNTINSSSSVNVNELTPSVSRKSRWSTKLSSVRSRSHSRNASKNRGELTIEQQIAKIGPQTRHLYDYAPKPEINSKLLLFWKKPARKCWWGNTECVLDVELPFDIEYHVDETNNAITILKIKGPGYCKLTIPVRLHIRRVWTLEVSIVGA